MSNIKIPSNNRYMASKKAATQNSVEKAFDDFKEILLDKTHPDNQTPAYKKNVISTLNRLLVAADELDELNPGEGIFGLIILCLRSSLRLKEERLKLEVKVLELEREVNRLKKNQGAKRG
jgi:hypothetical protein